MSAAADRRKWLALAVVGLARLLVIVDTTIVNIALPTAQADLGMSDVARQWAISAYTLTFGGLLLLGGTLADRLGRKNTLIVGALGFAVASAAGGMTSGPGLLIAARAAQGVFAALLAPSTLSLLTITFTEPKEHARAFGIFSAIMMSGGARSWASARSARALAFLLANVTVSTLLTRRLIPRTGPRPLLVIGLLLMAAGLAGLTQLSVGTSYRSLVLPVELVLGAGAGLAMPTIMNTIAASATASVAGLALPAVSVHGYAVANGWAAGIVAAGAIAVGLLARNK